jgi:hypothetical protein
VAHRAGQDVQIKKLENLLAGITVDFSEPPNDKERARLRKRRSRLNAEDESVVKATLSMRRLVGPSEIAAVYVRNEFVERGATQSTSLRGDPSDRRLPDKADRPPATRIMSPRGAALRVLLTALFEAQARTRPGQHPGNKRPLATGGSDVISWTDLLASGAKSSGTGKNHMSVSAKKIRQMESALGRLAIEELVELTRPGDSGARKYEQFELLNEGGRRAHGSNVAYQVPVPLREPAFPVPATLFTNGWIHVLEDTELTFILMMAARHHATGGQQFRVPAETRLLRFGIGRDAYEAHMMLSRLGLIEVTQDPGRHPDGKVKDFNSGEPALPHILGFIPAGFGRDALTTLRTQIDYQLSR